MAAISLLLRFFCVALCLQHKSSAAFHVRSPTPPWLGYSDVDEIHVKADRPQVNTTYGPVQGVYLENGVRGFLGVRYAAPPVGDLRWEPPQIPDKWDMYYAVGQPPACPQVCSDPPDDCPHFVSKGLTYGIYNLT